MLAKYGGQLSEGLGRWLVEVVTDSCKQDNYLAY
jgi:hypothetical protein